MSTQKGPESASPRASPAGHWWRWLPLAVLGAGIALVFISGADRLLSFDELARRYQGLSELLAAYPLAAVLVAATIYAAAIALSLPAAWLLTVAMGLLFGWLAGAVIVVFAATLGACILFLVARSALSGFFTRRAGPWFNRFAEGFRGDAASYLLFLRLAPVFPFTLLNVLPGILGVRFSTFLWTTFVGIIPGTLAYAYAGEGLRSVVARRASACAAGIPPCGEGLRAGDLVTPQVLFALFLLAAVSLLPVILKRFRAQRSPA